MSNPPYRTHPHRSMPSLPDTPWQQGGQMIRACVQVKCTTNFVMGLTKPPKPPTNTHTYRYTQNEQRVRNAIALVRFYNTHVYTSTYRQSRANHRNKCHRKWHSQRPRLYQTVTTTTTRRRVPCSTESMIMTLTADYYYCLVVVVGMPGWFGTTTSHIVVVVVISLDSWKMWDFVFSSSDWDAVSYVVHRNDDGDDWWWWWKTRKSRLG